MYCNSCGKEYAISETVCSGAHYYCDECKDTKRWPIERKYCAMCGEPLNRKNVKRFRNGHPFIASVRSGIYFCEKCREKKQPKYNLTQTDIDALIDPKKSPADFIRKAYREYWPNKNHVVVVYECACEITNKINHHYDYERPYEVVRLCNRCHRKEHYRLDRLRKAKAEEA